jgi:hypothetical protein
MVVATNGGFVEGLSTQKEEFCAFPEIIRDFAPVNLRGTGVAYKPFA